MRIVLQANIERPEDVPAAIDAGAEGIGLFRSEFMLVGGPPDMAAEDEQFHIYRQLVDQMAPRTVTVRTFDVDERQLARPLVDAALDALAPEPFVEVHPDDLAQLGFADGELVTVRSRRGAITLKAQCTHNVQRGSIFIPFHFREAPANLLTIDTLDPYAKIPEFKFCAVRIERARIG